MVITPEEAKRHLNIEQEYTDDDIYIQGIIERVLLIVEADICVSLDALPRPEQTIARQAALLLIGHYYAQREATVVGSSSSALPLGYAHLVNLLRRYGSGTVQ